jgi:hypothetical protein
MTQYFASSPPLKLRTRRRCSTFALRLALRSIHVAGAIGSGKSSSRDGTAAANRRADMKGLVCVAKPDEAARWVAAARANDREEHPVLSFLAANRRVWPIDDRQPEPEKGIDR